MQRAQILPDGGHASRSPGFMKAMLDIQTVEGFSSLASMRPVFLLNFRREWLPCCPSFSRPTAAFFRRTGGEQLERHGRAAMQPHGAVNSKFSFARLSAPISASG